MMYPDDPEDPRLAEQAEALLTSWPLKDREPSDWEALASAIDAKVRITTRASTPEELLAPPLPDAEDDEQEVERRSHPRMKRPAEGSLTALAQASLVHEHDTARDEMARTLLSQAVKARGEARLHRPTTSPGTPRPPAVQAVAQPPGPREPRHERRMGLGVAVGALGMAAAAVMFVWVQQSPQGTALPLGEPQAEVLTEAAPREAEAPQERTRTLPDAVPLADIPLETEPNTPIRVGAAPRAPNPAGALPQPPARALADEPSAAPEAPPPAGPSEPGMMMADSHGSDLPDRPSTGAIQAAVGSVLGSARACVAGHEAASRAAVQFTSDGRVVSVAVSGPASGTGAERCIQAALAGARVQPFSRPSYVVNLTVRP